MRAQADRLSAREAATGQQRKRGPGRSARSWRERRTWVVLGILLIAIVGGVIWLAGQQAASGGSGTGLATGQRAPGLDVAFPATQGGTMTLKQFEGHRKVVLYLYEGST